MMSTISAAEWDRRYARQPGDPPTIQMATGRHTCHLLNLESGFTVTSTACRQCRIQADELCRCGHFGRDHENGGAPWCERFTWWHDPSEWTP